MVNQNNGVKFYKLKNHIAGKHPALKMDERPKLLLSYLEKSVQHGVLEQVFYGNYTILVEMKSQWNEIAEMFKAHNIESHIN